MRRTTQARRPPLRQPSLVGILNRRGQFYFGGAVGLLLLVGILTLGATPHHDVGEDGELIRFAQFLERAAVSLLAYAGVVGAVEIVLRRRFVKR